MDVYKCTPDLNNEWSSPVVQENSHIQQFYKDRDVFITGGTGFMGKILIEKLLRCTEVSTVYLLVREKKGKDIHTRIDEILDDVVFERLNSEVPKFKHKIVGVSGDCTSAGLGLTITDRQTLIRNVNVVFHVAATVNFDEKLKTAFHINVKGTESVLELCKQMENLKALVHVSTAYSNCHLDKIDEVFYDYPVNYKDIELILEKLEDAIIDGYTPKCLGKWPNTYTFTKALAEQLIRRTGTGLPIGIFRPAIVTSTYKEPVAGWIDNLYGPTGVCTGAASGLLRTLHCENDVYANIVPVDTCISALMAIAWDTANRKCDRLAENVPIYNYVSTCENPITWREYNVINEIYAQRFPLSNALWCVKFETTSSKRVNALRKIAYHYLPAVLLDGLGVLSGRKPRLIKLYSKVHKFSNVISYFCTKNWDYTNHNVWNLWGKMNERDREIFAFSMTTVHWMTYFKTYILGIRLYLLKDPIATIKEADVKRKRYITLHNILTYTLTVLSANVIWNCVQRLTNLLITNKTPI